MSIMCTWHGLPKPICQPHNTGNPCNTTFHKVHYRAIIILRFRNYLHFAYSSSAFITYSPNLSPFLSTIPHHLACQDVFPMAGKTMAVDCDKRASILASSFSYLSPICNIKSSLHRLVSIGPMGASTSLKLYYGLRLYYSLRASTSLKPYYGSPKRFGSGLV